MIFMNAEITEKKYWLEIDGNCGTEFIPQELFDVKELRRMCNSEKHTAQDVLNEVRDYCENSSTFSATMTCEYGVRSSAAGYMDCTSWSVYTRKREALAAARQEQRECKGKD